MTFRLLRIDVAPPIPEIKPAADCSSQFAGHSERAMMVTSALVSSIPGRWIFSPLQNRPLNGIEIPEDSPLGCLIRKWKEGNFGQELAKDKLIDFCNHVWPQYDIAGMQWPRNGTLNHDIITPMMHYLQDSGKWEEIPYLDLFYYLGRRTDWQKECGIMVLTVANKKCRGCENRDQKADYLVKYKDPEEDVSLLVSPSAPPPETASEEEGEEGGETREKGDGKSKRHTPISKRTRGHLVSKKGGPEGGTHVMAPLREAVGPQGDRVMVKVPFSPNDLMIWKQSAGSYREDPNRTARVVKMARIIFEGGRVKLEIPEENIGKMFIIKEVEPQPIREEIEQAVVPWVWETGTPGKSKAAQPVVVELKEGKEPVRLKQYAIKPEVRREVAPIIDQYLNLGILQECESKYNTPIFPVKKPNGKYRLVQDLRAINEITKDIHPVVANPYTLLTSVSEKFEWFTVIDLKDAFFCIPLALESRKYFAFEWENPDTGRRRQLTWSRLPQGFKNSPTIFGNQLARELEEWKTT
ncbi:hypothetical protein DUI87_13529 [Hirundo rustica rustica]|uniref:ribonuclease H n=1 Tax=Hirundo rustica rustica TaxID=333673 RepID=A0A3M0K9F9_HIRRU|nr:hypothetical protein DUI87_13529 [Hirundo rustica rustica]